MPAALQPSDVRGIAFDVRDSKNVWTSIRPPLSDEQRQAAVNAGLQDADPLGMRLPTGNAPRKTPPDDIVRVAALVKDLPGKPALYRLLNLTTALQVMASAATGWTVPTPTPTPPATPLRRLVADPNAKGNGIAWNGGGARALQNTHVEGFNQNITVQNVPSLTLDNVRTVKAWRDDPNSTFAGQGLYTYKTGKTTIRGMLSGWNGWQEGKPVSNRSAFRHGLYGSFGSDIDLADSIFCLNSNCGAQFRDGGKARNCVFIDNGFGVFASMGNLELTDCLILGARYYRAGNAWTGLSGLGCYWPVKLTRVSIVGTVGMYQGDPTAQAAGGKMYPGNAIVCSTIPKATLIGHPEWKPPPTQRLIAGATNCLVAGWLDPFGGDLASKQDFGGIEVRTAVVRYDYGPILSAVLAGGSVAAAVSRIRSEVAALLA